MNEKEIPAILCKQSWAGVTSDAVIVVGETLKRFRIKCASDQPVKLAGRCRWLKPGLTVLIPKTAVKFDLKPEKPKPQDVGE